MNNKFLDKVLNQIISETRIIDNKVYTPFYPSPFLFPSPSSLSYFFLSPPSSPSSFSFHCKEVYCLNKEETEYVWREYKKELIHKVDLDSLKSLMV